MKPLLKQAYDMTARALMLCVVACGATDGDSACADRKVHECSESPECEVVSAISVHETGCADEATEVACMRVERACGTGYTYAHDPDGQAWMFHDTCIPAGWTDADPSNAVREVCGRK